MSFEELLIKLNREYLNSLPNKIKNIERLVNEADFSGLREAFHKLKGTGRTYGLPEVSDLAAAAEAICQSDAQKTISMALVAADLLKEIYDHRLRQEMYHLHSDPRFTEICKLAHMPGATGPQDTSGGPDV